MNLVVTKPILKHVNCTYADLYANCAVRSGNAYSSVG